MLKRGAGFDSKALTPRGLHTCTKTLAGARSQGEAGWVWRTWTARSSDLSRKTAIVCLGSAMKKLAASFLKIACSEYAGRGKQRLSQLSHLDSICLFACHHRQKKRTKNIKKAANKLAQPLHSTPFR